ncbi:checkpoint protein Hus1/Mec3 [Umbelopsis sp. PMI_123]|nr:checkpoint protein Hus1/Mec3 [Umbelopsis sp. PMI_123]
MYNANVSDQARPRLSENTRMRMKCQVTNTFGLYKLAQTLERMGSSLTLIFSPNSLQIVKWEAQAGGMQVWVTIPQGALFSSFRISSPLPGSEIPLDLRLEDLAQAMKSAQEFHNVSLQLIKKPNSIGDPRRQAYLEFIMGNDNQLARDISLTFEIPVRRIPTSARATIREPVDNRIPEVAILLPHLLSLRSDINLLKSQARYITLSANMAGEFRWRVDTELVTMEKQYQQLENPTVADGPGILQQYPDRSRDMFASARIPMEDLVNFLNCYHLNPTDVVCAIHDESHITLHVSVQFDMFLDHASRHRNEPTIMMYYIPAHSD